MAENTVNIFERASRLKARFSTNLGSISVEDLWDLPLTSTRSVSLDDIARSLNRSIKESAEESFVAKRTSDDDRLQLAFDVVKHVIDVKLAEREEAKTRAANREKKQELLAILADKDKEELRGKSREEIAALVEAL